MSSWAELRGNTVCEQRQSVSCSWISTSCFSLVMLDMRRIRLRCMLKKGNLDFRLCSGSWRISPVQVSHRPTACLFTFLQAGNQVVLEHQFSATDVGINPISFTLNEGGAEQASQNITTKIQLYDPNELSVIGEYL